MMANPRQLQATPLQTSRLGLRSSLGLTQKLSCMSIFIPHAVGDVVSQGERSRRGQTGSISDATAVQPTVSSEI
jgi:hypothetical protein